MLKLTGEDAQLHLVRHYNHHLLYPNTPIEVDMAEGRFHFYVEGQWDSWEKTRVGCQRRIKELIKLHHEFWTRKVPGLRPEWPGWQRINVYDFTKILEKHVPYSDLNQHH